MRMILDNGESYSGYSIYFVDTGDWDPDEVVRLFQLTWPDGEELARSECLDMRDPGKCTTIEKLVKGCRVRPDANYAIFSDRALTLIAETMKVANWGTLTGEINIRRAPLRANPA